MYSLVETTTTCERAESFGNIDGNLLAREGSITKWQTQQDRSTYTTLNSRILAGDGFPDDD